MYWKEKHTHTFCIIQHKYTLECGIYETDVFEADCLPGYMTLFNFYSIVT